MRRSSDARSSPSTYSIDRKWCAVDLADVVDAADVRVRDLAREAHLVVEALEAVGSRASVAGRNLSATGWPSLRSSAR